MSLKQKAVSSLFWAAFEQFGNQIIGFGISTVLARLLMPAEFGLIAMFTVFIAVGQALIDSGLTQSLIRTEKTDDKDYSTVFYFNLIVSIIVYILTYLISPYIADFFEQSQLTSIIRVYSIVFFINAFSAIQKTRLTKSMDFKKIMLVSTPSIIIGGSVGIVLALKGFGVWSLVWSAIAQAVASTIQFWYWSKWKPLWVFSKEKFKYHFGFGSRLLISGLLNTLFSNAYPIIIGKFYAPAQVGFYTKAHNFQKLPVGVISSVISKITYPLFSEIQNDDVRLKNIYKRIMQMVMFLVAPTLIFMAVLAEPIFRFLYTEKWLPAVPYFQILCAVAILNPIHSYNLQILNVKGRSDLFLKLAVVKKINVMIVLFITAPMGITEMLWGFVTTSLIAFFINSYYSGKFINYTFWQQSKDLSPFIIVAMIIGGSFYVLDSQTFLHDLPDIIRVFTGLFICFALYLGIGYSLSWSVLKEIKNLKN